MSTHTSRSGGEARNDGNPELPLSAEQEARAMRLHRDATIVDGTALDYTL